MRSKILPFKYLGGAMLAILLSMGVLGVSYAYFSDVTRVKTTAVMGNMDVVFSDVQFDGGPADPACAEAKILNDGKSIGFDIENVAPGYITTIQYEVTNRGTVPVCYELIQPAGDGPVDIKISRDTDYIAPNGTSRGQITFTVKESTEQDEACGVNVALNFQQAAVVSWQIF